MYGCITCISCYINCYNWDGGGGGGGDKVKRNRSRLEAQIFCPENSTFSCV